MKVWQAITNDREDIRSKINTDPDMILEAFNMIALAPTKVNTVLQVGRQATK